MTRCILSEIYERLKENSDSSILKTKAPGFSDAFVYMYQTTRCHILKDWIIYNHRLNNWILQKYIHYIVIDVHHQHKFSLVSWSLNWSMVFYTNTNLNMTKYYFNSLQNNGLQDLLFIWGFPERRSVSTYCLNLITEERPNMSWESLDYVFTFEKPNHSDAMTKFKDK